MILIGGCERPTKPDKWQVTAEWTYSDGSHVRKEIQVDSPSEVQKYISTLSPDQLTSINVSVIPGWAQ